MQNYLTPLRVGVVLIIGIAAFIWYVFETSDSPITRGDGYRVQAVFNDAMGLVRKSRVVIAGISVGEIENIELEGGRARVHLKIHKSIVLHQDASIRKIPESILGTSLLELSAGNPNLPPLKDGDEITRIVASTGMDDLMARMGDITNNVRDITDVARGMMEAKDPDQGSVRGMVDDLSRIIAVLAGTIEQNNQNITRILQNSERISEQVVGLTSESRGEVRDILREISSITKTARELTDNNRGKVDETMQRLTTVMEKLENNLDRLQDTLGHTASIAKKIDEGEGAVGTLINDEQVAEDIRTITGKASDYVRKLDQLKTAFHIQSDFYPRAMSFKTAASLRLIPRKDKYYMIGIVDDHKGRTTRSQTIIMTSNSEDDAFIREERIKTSYDIKFDLQYAQRFKFATLRFGIIESTGGLGLDFQFFDDRLIIRNDVYEFTSGETYPRWKTQLNIRLWKGIFISGGVDDVINNNTRDYFVGAGILFYDEDLITLFASGAGGAAGAVAR